MRKISIAMLLVLGMWHTALALVPGGEEKGGKSKDQELMQDKSGPGHGASQAEQAALLALQGADDATGAESNATVSTTSVSSTSKRTGSMAEVIGNRKASQMASVERAEMRKSLKSTLKAHKQAQKSGSPLSPLADDMMVICVILCFFIPPLAVYLWEDSIGINFWISLILTLLFWVPGVIFSLIVVLTT